MVVRERVSRSFLVGWLASAAIIGGAVAQEKQPAAQAAGAPLPEEAAVFADGAKELGTYAAACLKQGFPVRARDVWQEVLGEYAPDDDAARKALGFYRHGAVWQRDPKFEFPQRDEPNAAAARQLEQRWQAMAGRLAAAHRTLAAALAQNGHEARSRYHAQRALRFQPEDGKAAALGGLRQVEGITGDDVDIAVLQRSRRMDRAITRLQTQAFPAGPVDEQSPLLAQCNLPHRAVRSTNFTVYGDWDLDVLQQAAVWAERALAFCQEAYEGCAGFPPRSAQSRKFVFLKTKAAWAQVVRKHVRSSDAEFVVANASSTEIGDVETSGAEQVDVVYDLAVRWVAQDYSGLGSDAMEEGIGHAIVGMFFGRNLVFSVGQQELKGTVAGPREQQKLLLPDMDTWVQLAIDLAWQETGTRAARLPLLKAAQFPTDGRIKAWSFCDYLLRRDPLLLRHLDRTAAKARTENDVLGLFQEYAGQPLQHVEDRWRRFWTEDSPLRRAVVGKTTPLEAASKEAPAWLDLFNRLRQQYGAPTVGWSAQQSIACKAHVDYLKANKDQRDPAEESTQVAGKPGFSNAGRSFAATALVWTREPKLAGDAWILLPGFRDALLDKNLDTVGIYAEAGVVVLDAVRGRKGGPSVTTQTWPQADQQGGRKRDPVPAAVDVELLGPDVQRLLATHQRGKQKQIGLPLTLHLYTADATGVTCTVTCQQQPVAGVLVPAQGAVRRTSAQGMWVFYPFEPLKRGVDVTAVWKWKGGEHTVTFVAQ